MCLICVSIGLEAEPSQALMPLMWSRHVSDKVLYALDIVILCCVFAGLEIKFSPKTVRNGYKRGTRTKRRFRLGTAVFSEMVERFVLVLAGSSHDCSFAEIFRQSCLFCVCDCDGAAHELHLVRSCDEMVGSRCRGEIGKAFTVACMSRKCAVGLEANIPLLAGSRWDSFDCD